MKANSGVNPSGKDRKRKIASDQAPEQERTKVPQSASRRHREKINATLEELGGLLPLPEESRSKLDKLTVLKLSVSFFQTQNYLQSGKRKRRVDDAAVNEITKQLEECNINVSDISLEALDSFFLVLSETGDVFFASENVYRYLGYTQTFLMHQNFLSFVHHDDVVGFERCLRRSARARIMELDSGLGLDCKEFEEQPIPQVCFCSIKCHAGRQSSHVSPFYYRSFKFDGHIKPLLNGKMKQYGLFALCTPVNPANPFTSTPKELLQVYSCKMGLDLRIRKLDNRGQKSLFYSDKQAFNLSGYMIAHPDDIPCLMLAHQQLTATGTCEIVMRLTNGQGIYQWMRGKARTLYDKNGKPECVTADNVLLNNEQGPYFRKVVFEMLCEWKAKQKGLPSPESEDDRSPADDTPPPTGGPSGAPSGAMLPTGGPPPPSGQLQPGRPCPPSGLHPPDGPLPPSRPCPSGEAHPPEGPLLPGRLLPSGRPLASGRLHSPTVPLPPSAMESNDMSGAQGLAVMPDEDLLEDSKDIEIIEYNGPSTAAEFSGPVLHSFGLTAGSSESCMFSSPHLNRSPVEEKPTIAQDGTIYSFKTERRSGDAAHIGSKPNHSAYEQINLIKQFLMGGDPNPPSNVRQSDNTVRINGGSVPDIPPPWANYPVETSPVLTEINYQQDDRGSVLYPPQNGMQSSYYANDCRVPGMSEGHANLPQFGRPQQPDTDNLIYPFPPDINGHVNPSNSFTNGVSRQDIPELPVSIDSLNKSMQNGSDFTPAFPFPEGSLHHSFKPQYQTGQNGFNPGERAGGFSKVVDCATTNHPAHDFNVNAGVPGIPRQDTSLWFSSPDNAQLPQNVDVPPIEVLSVDELTPSLCVDHMAPYRNAGKFQNGNIMESVHTVNVCPPPNGIHLNQPMAQNVQKQNFQNTHGNGKNVHQPFQSGGNSLLKMMLTQL